MNNMNNTDFLPAANEVSAITQSTIDAHNQGIIDNAWVFLNNRVRTEIIEHAKTWDRVKAHGCSCEVPIVCKFFDTDWDLWIETIMKALRNKGYTVTLETNNNGTPQSKKLQISWAENK